MDICSAIRLAQCCKWTMHYWEEYLRRHVQPYLDFPTLPRHLAMILAEFQGLVGRPGVVVRSNGDGGGDSRTWWMFSQRALDRMIAPALRCRYEKISFNRHHRLRLDPENQLVRNYLGPTTTTDFSIINAKHMAQMMTTRLREKRKQVREAIERENISHAILTPGLLGWIEGLYSVRSMHKTLWRLMLNQGGNRQFVKADIQELRDTALHALFCDIANHIYGRGTAIEVLACRVLIKTHQQQLWDALRFGRLYDVETFIHELHVAVNRFDMRIRARLMDICSDSRIAILDAAQILQSQCQRASPMQMLDIMRCVKRPSRLEHINIWHVIHYHMFAASLVPATGTDQLLCFVETCFPHHIHNGPLKEPPTDRCCVYQTLSPDVIFSRHIDGVELNEPHHLEFIEKHRNVHICTLARDIDWAREFSTATNVIAIRHAILYRIFQLQNMRKRAPDLWIRPAKRAHLVQS